MNKFQKLNSILDKTVKVIFIISIALIFYTLYRSEVVYSGLYRDYYFKYYIFLISSLIIIIFVSLLNKKIQLKIYAMLISTIVGLYLCEILLIDFKNINNKTKLQYYLESKKKQDVTIAVYPFEHLLKNINKKKIFPLSGVSNKLTIYCQRKEDKKFVTYDSDRYGFRNNDTVWEKESTDFLFIGDSFVHGSCVSTDYTISSQLSKILKEKLNKETNIINLGFSGNGPLIEYASLKEYLKYSNAKKILYFFYEGNDLTNLNIELKDPFLKKYLNNNFEQNLASKQSDINKVNNIIIDKEIKKKDSGLYDFVKLTKLRKLLSKIFNQLIIIQPHYPSEETFLIYKDILTNIKKLSDNKNAELYFIYLPYVSRFSDQNFDKDYKIYSRVMTIVKSLNIKYIDLLSNIESEYEVPLSIFELGKHQHLNNMGYKFIAETIIKKIN